MTNKRKWLRITTKKKKNGRIKINRKVRKVVKSFEHGPNSDPTRVGKDFAPAKVASGSEDTVDYKKH